MKLNPAQKTIVKAAITAVAMFAFVFWVMVPLYNVLCKVTGLNGKTDPEPYTSVPAAVDESRLITVQFLATNNKGMNWDFKPSVHQVKIHPGEIGSLSFYVRNPSDKDMVGQAIPSVSPFEATDFLHKTECFCFTSQPLEARGEKTMPLKIIVDQDLPKHIKKLTLSYTLFDITALDKRNGNKKRTAGL
ncbi:cytochrome c oxidase assembly protein [Sansalvadorimonas sp. 2012CJ34-2]|uniref:Cytochrome c oxidase assembly protein CtaG n=1 Tax=Parendozoicomonas callyspongiae TaxID=2942213 RepID=A0ABT0PAR9_9GAMM|nr:cytochrome c oxidase assembly protein [Sansalvadorimonas sp. 2012CJ34-2]MCL6268489.1 cytochrome c oxidase assembly protein [Sansalvadorimonas sp. 2012CJ34-2]